MSYATLTQLSDRYGGEVLIQLTDRTTPPAGAVDEDVINRASADADSLIDGYLAGRYALPLAATPPLITDLALKIAIYNLHRFAPDQKIKDDYEDAVATLEKIAKGMVRLDVAGVEPEASGATGVRASDRARDLTPDNLKGFI